MPFIRNTDPLRNISVEIVSNSGFSEKGNSGIGFFPKMAGRSAKVNSALRSADNQKLAVDIFYFRVIVK
jgi:hypothetical protein